MKINKEKWTAPDPTPTPPVEDWEKEFDEQFGVKDTGPYFRGLSEDIKDFIRSLLIQARADERRNLLEQVKPVEKILQYIATRNELHNAVCIPKAQEALDLLCSITPPDNREKE